MLLRHYSHCTVCLSSNDLNRSSLWATGDKANKLFFFSCVCVHCYRVSDLNIGRLVRGDRSTGFVPPLSSAVLDLLEKHGEWKNLS